MQIICNSIAMREVARRIERASLADCPVVIWGEEGSGKRFIAEGIHRRSRRCHGPLVTVRAHGAHGISGPHGATAEGTPNRSLEDELFGTSQRPGRLAQAVGGTLLVDEITQLPPTAQARLLGVAEGRDVVTSAPGVRQPLDFRLMATTRFDLGESVRRGTLREDLRYRIGVVVIHIPPLRERRDDIPELLTHLLNELCAARGRQAPTLELPLIRLAADYHWPGNVAQLNECLEIMLEAGESPALTVDHLRAALAENATNFPGAPSSQQQVATLARLERAAVTHALEVHDGNRTQAAKSLGISVRTLQRKLRRWKL